MSLMWWYFQVFAICRPEDEVSKIVKSCDDHKVPVVPYGGATSIEGHTLSPNGGVCIDMTSMKRVKSLNVEDMDVVVESGIGWMELNEYLEPCGLFYPLDPGLGATIGGMCATRCSGSLAFFDIAEERYMAQNQQMMQLIKRLQSDMEKMQKDKKKKKKNHRRKEDTDSSSESETDTN